MVIGLEKKQAVKVGDALDNMHVIDACFESTRTGRAVEIPNNIHQGGVVS